MAASADRSQLEQAIVALEAQRAILGDAVVDTAVLPLKAKLAALDSGTPVSIEQRKMVTVLFADVMGFTTLSEAMDAEDVKRLMDRVFARLDSIVIEHGGVIDKHIGDAVMALWGVEATREDDPERAIGAALAMQAALKEVNNTQRPSDHPPLMMRMGINTGPAVLGEVGSSGEFTALGDAINIASRLQAASPPGEVLISHDTYRHVRGVFEVEQQPLIKVKGKVEPLQAYLVKFIKPRAFRIGTRGVEGVDVRMIGRDQELKILQDAYLAAYDGLKARMVTLTGDAGLGKSRLVAELLKWLELRPEGIWLFQGRASQQMMSTPYGVLRDLLADRFEIQESDSMDVARLKLVNGVKKFEGAEAEQAAHFIGQLIGLDFSASPYLAGVLGDSEQVRTRAFRYLSKLFEAVHLGNGGPVVIVLEDLQWADDKSLGWITEVIQDSRAMPMLVLALGRPALFERKPDWGQGEAYQSTITLTPLPAQGSRLLVSELLQKIEQVPDVLAEMITTRSEGNPFYMEELVKMLIDDHVIVANAEQWTIEAQQLTSIKVPLTLTGVLQSRLDSLPQQEKATLQRASVVGRVFWDSAIAQLGEGDVIDPREALEALNRRELIYRKETSAFGAAVEYTFKHSILHDVAYESVLKRKRRLYHKQTADWLVDQSGERAGEFLGLIAEHYERANDTENAVAYLERAADRAMRISAYSEALEFSNRASNMLGTMASPSMVRVKTMSIEALINLGLHQEARSILLEITPVAETLDEKLPLAQLHKWMGQLLVESGQYAEAEAELKKGLEIAETLNVPRSTGDILWRLGMVQWRDSKVAEARSTIQKCLDISRAEGDKLTEGAALNYMGVIHSHLHEWDEATRCYEETKQIAQETGHRLRMMTTLTNLGEVYRQTGRYDQAHEAYWEALEISRELGIQRGIAVVTNNLGFNAVALGKLEEARRYALESLTLSIEIGMITGIQFNLIVLADVEEAKGNYDRALELLGAVEAHPAQDAEVQQYVRDRQEALWKKVDLPKFEEASARGRACDFEKLIEEELNSKEKV
jgi:class 3 adenylate cyclase/tetratricopeptide (TPR) repeat protein